MLVDEILNEEWHKNPETKYVCTCKQVSMYLSNNLATLYCLFIRSGLLRLCIILLQSSQQWWNNTKSVEWVSQTESNATWSKFHGESFDNLFIFIKVATQCFVQQLWWHISLEVWFIYLNVCCCNCCICCWVNVNKSKKVVSLVAKIFFTSKLLGSRSNEWQQ